ncbi:MAG: hemolysin family protein [Anaerolineae bacterium]
MTKVWLLVVGFPGVALLTVALATEGLPGPQTLILPAVVILALIALNGLFVAAEFAINGVRITQIEELVEAGNRTAPQVMSVLQSPARQDRYIATAQLGITVASLGLGMYGEPQIARFIEPYLAQIIGARPEATLVHTVGYIAALSLLTYLHVVLGEMIPKSIALSRAKRAALALASPMRIMALVFGVPVRFLNGAGRLLLRLLKIPPGQEHLHSPAELEQIVAESAERGLLNEEEEELIRNIFTFGEREAHQVMTPRRKIQAIPLNIPLAELIKLTSESRFSRFPVYERNLDHIIGILHLKDLIRQQLRAGDNFDLRPSLRPAPTIPESYPAEQLLSAFKRRRMHMAIVLDEFGGTAGIVTLEDLVEEIIGEVRDEFDKKEQDPLIELAPGSLEVSGQYLVDDLKEHLFWGDDKSLPAIETVGGLIVTGLGRPPQVGDRLTYGRQIKFTVLAIDGLAVARARIDFPVEERKPERGPST